LKKWDFSLFFEKMGGRNDYFSFQQKRQKKYRENDVGGCG